MDPRRQVIPGASSYKISAETDVRLFVAVTDYDWFQVHAAQSSVEEVNFWQPSPDSAFKALSPGEPLLFKLHSPCNFIAGGD
jgi:putative restriction endonuclease